MHDCVEGGLAEVERQTYSPRWASHVVGTYDVRTFDPETGAPSEQRIDILCRQCGVSHVVFCQTGNVREHVAIFARIHAHRDPMTDPVP